MLICVSCNIEYKEDKKFCSYCGGPLVTKEDLTPSEKDGKKKEEEKLAQKLICPNCKIIYEFGISCIQCGSALVREIPSKGKDALKTDQKKHRDEREPAQASKPKEPQIETPLKKLICPTCKIIYERGDHCVKCGLTLVSQTSTQPKEMSKTIPESEIEGKPIPLQTLQEQLIGTPPKKLICPTCKIIYERGNSCVRCGSALVMEIPAQEGKLPEAEINPSASQPEGQEKGFSASESTEIAEISGQGPITDVKRPVIPSPKGRDLDDIERAKKKELEITQSQKVKKESEEMKEEPLGPEAPEQQPVKRSTDDLERTLIRPRKPGLDYRKFFLEVGSISIMVLAGGYFLWSIYSHLIAKSPEPKATTFKRIQSLDLPKPPIPTDVTPTVSIPRDSVVPPVPSHATSSDDMVVETLEIEKIKSLLDHIRQANLEKNIDLFISCYATDFKDREGKKKATLTYWKNFDYLDLSYGLKNPSISAETAEARVEWVIKISSKTGGRPQESKTIFDVRLKKEGGEWKIREVKQVG
jgi:rRNA maturation endonuclease Nob1